MSNESKDYLKDPTESICPFLGLIDDSKTTTTFATSDHVCYQSSPPGAIVLSYQRSCCLDPSHVDCPGFIDGWKDGLPKRLRGQKSTRRKTFLPSWVLFLGLGVIIVILVIGAILQLTGSENRSTATMEGELILPTSTKTSTLSATSPSTITHTPTETVEPTLTITPSPTVIPTQTAGPQLSTPFGQTDLVFAVHEVLPGETLSLIAKKYSTDPLIIEAINQSPTPGKTSLWVGEKLVICVGCDNADGLPKLQAIFIDSQTSLVELAENYDTAIEELIDWNDLGEEDQISFPRWIIVKAPN